MKLRIRGNSIRLRLTQSEVSQLVSNRRVESKVSFGNKDEDQLTYTVTATDNVNELTARFRNNEIAIFVPEVVVTEWASTETVGIEAMQQTRDSELSILIEKDFACLKPRAGEDDTDTFTNPLAATGG